MENIFTLKVKDAVAKGQALADDIWLYKHPGEPIQAEDSEYLSWVNSTPRFLKVAMDAGLGELDAIFEMPTPDGGYVDVVLAGSNAGNATENRLMLVELKQWCSCSPVLSTICPLHLPKVVLDSCPPDGWKIGAL